MVRYKKAPQVISKNNIYTYNIYTYKIRKNPSMTHYYQVNCWVLKSSYSKTLSEKYKCALSEIDKLKEKINNLMQLLGD